MIKVTKTEMKEKLLSFLNLGMTNAEIADRLNAEYSATPSSKMTALGVAKLKKALNMSNTKPKKKALFELIDDGETFPANEDQNVVAESDENDALESNVDEIEETVTTTDVVFEGSDPF